MLNFVACDDNLNILDRLCKLLESIFINNNLEAQVIYKSDNVNDILDFVNNNKVDVLILDIDLKANQSGLQIAEAVRKRNKDIYLIFSTGHLEYAMVAYKYKTFDFLAKPVTYERLESTILRLFDDIYGSPKRYLKIDNKNTLVDANDILYIKRDGMKVVFHTAVQDYEVYTSFTKIETSLPNSFVRCHKSFIINLNNVSNVDWVTSTVYFGKDSCFIGPKYKNFLKEVLSKYEHVK